MLWSENRTLGIESMEVCIVGDNEISVLGIKSVVEDRGRLWDKIMRAKEISELRSQYIGRIIYVDIEITMKDEKAVLETVPLCLKFRS